MRLRQVALVCADLERVVSSVCSAFGLAVAYRDPEVAVFGLSNAVIPVGTQFLEVVSPFRDDTAGGRQMARMGGDGGYMVICQVPSLEAQAEVRSRATSLGVREALTHVDGGSSILQFHPGDTGGSFLEVDCDTTEGGWSPAGANWPSSVQTSVVTGIGGVTVGTPTPDLTASTWAAILGISVVDRVIELEEGVTIRFVDADVHALVRVSLAGVDQVPEVRVGGLSITG